MLGRSTRTAAVSLAFLLGSIPARADEDAGALFDRGLAAMLKRDYATGCPLLAASQKRDPRLGTLFTLAECEAAWDKPGRALSHYQAFLRDYRRGPRSQANDERSKIAETKTRELGPRAAYVTLVASGKWPSDVPVKIDDERIDEDAIGVEMPVDPGDIVVRIGEGPSERSQKVVLSAGERRTVLLTVPAPVAPPPKRAEPLPPPPPPPSSSISPVTWASGATTVVALGLGAVTGILVLGKKSDIDGACPGDVCSPSGRDDVSTARTLGTVSTVSFVVAGVAAAVTVASFVWSSKPSRPVALAVTW